VRYRGRVADRDAEELLDVLGISVVTAEVDPAVHAECIRIARRLRAERHKIIGFIPADHAVAVPALLIQLGNALAEITSATIALVDANVRFPALSEIASQEKGRRAGVFSTRWLRGSLALLTPEHAEQAGEAVPQLARLLLDGVELFEFVLVDLTGFDLLGEQASAASCMDAVVLVGEVGRSREADVRRFLDELPSSRFLGMLLVG
jgi:hypothetical protein